MSREAGVPEETAVSAACDAQRLRLLGPGDRWERARIFCSARTVRAFTCQASRGAPAWAPRRRAVLDASGGGTVSSTKTLWYGAVATMMRAGDGRGGGQGSA